MCSFCWNDLQEYLWFREWETDSDVVTDDSVELENTGESAVSSTAETLVFGTMDGDAFTEGHDTPRD